MSSSEHELELADERATERRYADQLHEDQRRRPRPFSFTGRKVPELPAAIVGQLVGRVGLRKPDDVYGKQFYIGEKPATVGGIEVCSWLSPIAKCTFFQKVHEHAAHEGLGQLCASAVVIRSFGHADGQIAEFADDALAADAADHPFPKRGLVVPDGPSRPLPRPKPVPTEIADHGSPSEAPKSQSRSFAGDGVRAEALLRAQLRAPRTSGLGPVISTLQSEQYELVTVPAMDSMVIEGKPGTGKTIIASHRAVYMVSDETPPENSLDGKVLIVGPTPEYSRHIRAVIERLADHRDRVIILSMPELMQRLIGTNDEPQGPATTSWQDVDWMICSLSGKAIHLYRAAKGAAPSCEVAYECLRANASEGHPITQNVEWTNYLKQLPPYKEALTKRVRWPLLAFIAWNVDRPVDLMNIEHIIVDEAQDVTEMEWFLLQGINQAHAWTILGDLNQRRSDFTYASWKKILDILAVDEDTPIKCLKRAYRSTKPILEFANKLLSREERSLDAFQDGGVMPTKISVSPKALGEAVVAEVDRLIGTYPTGTIAVISVQPDLPRKALRVAGWSALSLDLKRWRHKMAEIVVIEPDSARGLEFDAVIVVEPADFPMNYNRQGPLYTALTRGNRELSVVRSKPLPEALRR